MSIPPPVNDWDEYPDDYWDDDDWGDREDDYDYPDDSNMEEERPDPYEQ